MVSSSLAGSSSLYEAGDSAPFSYGSKILATSVANDFDLEHELDLLADTDLELEIDLLTEADLEHDLD
jgi:hypothetical protein